MWPPGAGSTACYCSKLLVMNILFFATRSALCGDRCEGAFSLTGHARNLECERLAAALAAMFAVRAPPEAFLPRRSLFSCVTIC